MRSRDGGFINKSVFSTPASSGATGVWFLDECRQWSAAARWPIRTISFYAVPELFDISARGQGELTIYFTTDYQSYSIKWERRLSGSSSWSTVSGATSNTITVQDGGFFYRMVVTAGIKTAKSPEVEIVKESLINFVWTEHPANEQRPEGNLFYFSADGIAYGSGNNIGYTVSQMNCQWQTLTPGSASWVDIPEKTTNTLWIVAGAAENGVSGTQYRLRVIVPQLGTFYSNSATLTVV